MGRRISVLMLAAALAFALTPSASGASLQWSQKLGRDLQGVTVDAAGNVYVVGRTTIPGPEQAAVLAKYGPGGTKRWSRLWSPGASDYAFGTSVAIGRDGTVFWGGVVHAKGCEGGGWFVRAFTPSGRLLWHKDQRAWERCTSATFLSDLAVGRGIVALALTDHGCCGDTFSDGYVRTLDPRDGSPRWATEIEPAGGVPARFNERVSGISVGGLGHVFVTGWAATEKMIGDTESHEGVVYLQKLSSGGELLWRRHVRRIDFSSTQVHISVRGDRLMLATIAHAGSIYWGGGRPPQGWLGRFDLGGDHQWSRTWGEGWRHGAVPTDVSIGPGKETWVVGTTRDASDRGHDLFARRYSAGGALQQVIRLDGPTKTLWGGGIEATAGGAAFTGTNQTRFGDGIGRVWVYGPG